MNMGRKKKDTTTTTNIDQNDANNLTIAVNYDEKLQLDLMGMWKKILKWDREKLFVDPVKEEIAPGYFQIVKNPMDLSTIKQKLDSKDYVNHHDFEHDIQLICTNAMAYNDESTIYHKKAKKMLSQCMNLFCGVESSQICSQELDNQIQICT